MTIKTSVSGGNFTTFYIGIRLDTDAAVICPPVEVDTLLHIYRLEFYGRKGTNKISFGTGVYFDYFKNPTDAEIKYGDILSDGCVFKSFYPGNIYPRSEKVPDFVKSTVIKCPHGNWDGNECKYCGFVCNHDDGYVDGVCPVCQRACEHKNLDGNYYCGDCKQQMTAEVKTADGTVTYGTDFAAMMNAAESGATVTLLYDTELSENVYVYGGGKTVTLDLNGHSVGGSGKAFYIGKTSSAKYMYGTLKIAGKGKILTALIPSETGNLDLSGWTGGEFAQITVCAGSSVTGSIPSDAYIGTLFITGYARETMVKIDEINLDGGSYGEIKWLNSVGTDLPIGILLATGYAFKKGNSFVPYTEKLAPNESAYSVRVVKCEVHADTDSDGMCDYCNAQLAASVADGDGAVYKYYADINEAVNAQLELGASYTVKLLCDAGIGSNTFNLSQGFPRIDLNGHKVGTFWLKGDCRLTILGNGTVEYISISGNEAGLASTAVVAKDIWIMHGATWSSILPDASFGYKVYNEDKSSYTWYDSSSVEKIATSAGTVNNVSIEPLPVEEKPILMIDSVPIENGRVVSNGKGIKFSIALGTPGAE